MVCTCICIGSVVLDGISMIDFTKGEYEEVRRMMDSMRLMCAQRYTCRECPLFERVQGLCTATLLVMNVADFEYRHKHNESRK